MAEARLPTRLLRGRVLSRIVLGLFCLAGGALGSQAADAVLGELQLRNGDHWSGQFAEGSSPNEIRWQSPVATAPFAFVPASVGAAYFPPPKEQANSPSPFCVELVGGDMLFGKLEALSQEELVLATPHFGNLTISTASVARVLPWGDSSSIRYLGPNGLRDWRTEPTVSISRRDKLGEMQKVKVPTPAELGWREAAGQLIVDRASEAIGCECPIPSTCSIELSLGWQSKPDFGVTLFIEEQGGGVFPLRLQVVELDSKERQLIAIAEGETSADLVPLAKLSRDGGRFHAIVYVDAEGRSAEIRSIDGKPLGRLQLPVDKAKADEEETEPDPVRQAQARQRRIRPARADSRPAPPKRKTPGIAIVNRSSDLRFERLLVRGWNGRLPAATEGHQGVVVTAKGHISWKTIAFDSKTSEIVSSDGEQETRTPLAELTSLTFPLGNAESVPAYRMTLHDGTRVSGTLQACRDGKLELKSEAIAEQLKTPAPLVSSLVSLLPAETEVPELNGRKGHLETKDLRSQGVLVEGPQDGASPLVWLPWGSSTPQPLAVDITGRIVYRQPRSTDEAQESVANQRARRQAQQQPQPRGLFQMIIGGGSRAANVNEPATDLNPREQAVIYMRSGDRFPGKLVRITETTAHFESPIIEATAIPLDEMAMWERDRRSQLDELDPEKRRRLLTIPRMQRNNPPTHLFETFSGDFLRARLVGIEEDQVIVEVRLEEKEIALSTIRRILWLEGTSDVVTADAEEEPAESLPEESAGGQVVLAVAKDNTRLAFTPLKMEGGSLSGVSQHLGDCQVTLADIDILYLGAQAARQSLVDEVAKWKMIPAKDPKFVNEDDADDPSKAGLDAPLVGEVAPDFILATLDDKKFKLSDQKGKIVVLDFFATWCGPCIQAMPEVDSIAAEFKDQGVELVAVNMQEDATSVKRLLERLKIEPKVALDIDGATAEKYGVTAIPQTVIIDREGKVARLYVGGGPTFAAQLREALKSLTGEPAADDAEVSTEPAPATTES